VRLSEPGGESPYDVARRRERSLRVQRALLKLSFEHRLVLVLREVEGLSCEEIAQATGVARGTVKSRLARAREAFRRVFRPEEEIP
jgi:RNA polymerase sigma-70 factor (ECF subfamily)